MGRAFTFIIFFTMFTIALELMGVGVIGQSVGTFIGFNDAGDLQTGIDLTNSPFWIAVLALLAITTTGGLVVGLFSRSQIENYILLPFIAIQGFIFVDVFAGALKEVNTYPIWLSGLIVTLFLGTGIGYAITMIEWFRGNV